MKHPVLVCCALAALASCGGKSNAPTAQVGGAAAGPVAAGIHACHFVIDGEPYGQHRCDVSAGDSLRLQKASGMETFDGTLTPMDGGLHLTAKTQCAEDVVPCEHAFEAHLKQDGGAWKGEVQRTGGPENWWIAGATFVLDDSTAYGGQHYGASE